MYAAGCKTCIYSSVNVCFIVNVVVPTFSHPVTACLDALSGHTAQGHHWLVAGGHSASPDQPVHTPLCGDSPL